MTGNECSDMRNKAQSAFIEILVSLIRSLCDLRHFYLFVLRLFHRVGCNDIISRRWILGSSFAKEKGGHTSVAAVTFPRQEKHIMNQIHCNAGFSRKHAKSILSHWVISSNCYRLRESLGRFVSLKNPYKISSSFSVDRHFLRRDITRFWRQAAAGRMI
ncbi:MAG: hypothetical protein P4L61_01745 [Candidatus Pacebacteria bacterium]|nr:hypothetical protein [Candidatus Paceibacterota bacterium]